MAHGSARRLCHEHSRTETDRIDLCLDEEVGGTRKTRFCGLDCVGLHFTLVSTAYNLVRIAQLGLA